MADRYGWCHTAQCVAEWSWGQNANNLFTLLGAAATFAAAFLALRFSQRESKRRLTEDQTRAKLAAVANLHSISEMADFAERIVVGCTSAAIGAAASPRGVVRELIVFIDVPYAEINDADLLMLAALPSSAAFLISRGFAAFRHVRDQRARFWQMDHEADATKALAWELIGVIKEASQDFALAAGALKEAAKF